MVPGISSDSEARIADALDPRVTDVTRSTFEGLDFTLLDGSDAEAQALGIECAAEPAVTVVVTDATRPLGRLRIEAGGLDNVVFFDNRTAGGHFYANLRIRGSDCVLFFNDFGDGYVAMPDVYLRSDSQFLFWGRFATAVGFNVEIEGVGRGVTIGDDALISAGVWVRNHDMHSMHDLRTGAHISRPPVDTVIERHVWLGQDALLLNCQRVGMGTIVGARSLVKGIVPARVIAAGMPARIIREGVSWGRQTGGMTDAERLSIGVPELDAHP